MSIPAFLETVATRLASDRDNTHVVLVSGNDSADLDSIIASLLFAFLSDRRQDEASQTLFVPYVKVPFADLALRPEVGYVFDRAGISTTSLICADRARLDEVSQLEIAMVDHNRLTPPLSDLTSARVISILDHHVDEGCYPDASPRWVEMVGSCTSQVLLYFEQELKTLSKEDMTTLGTLALAPILVDSVGLRWEMGKTTQKDVDAFGLVAPFVFGTVDTQATSVRAYYNKIESVKSQIDHLSCRDLLRKDYKEWVVNGYRVGTSAMSWYLHGWLDRDGQEKIVHEAYAYADERSLDLEIVMTSYDHGKDSDDGKYQREMAFFVVNEKLLSIKTTIENDAHVGLSPLIPSGDHRVGFYSQANIKLSRKQIWPMVQALLEQL
ncbi:DHH phosphoesterase [Hesseltinella vesiculosa]|uniref:DHH phosphoesterase n=1 Tax=Hesseltinella vesiculosa TaxID=101127 RepID=A0A1X2G2T7_9FUNG|nr:DHH phosphoesterase [Hesseltinella vesiculosa]